MRRLFGSNAESFQNGRSGPKRTSAYPDGSQLTSRFDAYATLLRLRAFSDPVYRMTRVPRQRGHGTRPRPSHTSQATVVGSRTTIGLPVWGSRPKIFSRVVLTRPFPQRPIWAVDYAEAVAPKTPDCRGELLPPGSSAPFCFPGRRKSRPARQGKYLDQDHRFLASGQQPAPRSTYPSAGASGRKSGIAHVRNVTALSLGIPSMSCVAMLFSRKPRQPRCLIDPRSARRRCRRFPFTSRKVRCRCRLRRSLAGRSGNSPPS